LHSAGDTVNTTVNGTKAVATAGSDELLASMKLDATDFSLNDGGAAVAGEAIPVIPRLPGATTIAATHVSPLQLIARMGRLLDQQFVDTSGRWLVIDPVFAETLKDEDSRLFNSDFGGSGLQNGLIINNLHGFRVYVSNNTPAVGTGPAVASSTLQDDNFGVIVAGHDSAVATAQQINKTETYRDPDSFADIVRGMHLYGRKILRPEAIVTARYNTGY
jgi:P22 coat protein - gene protein 5.